MDDYAYDQCPQYHNQAAVAPSHAGTHLHADPGLLKCTCLMPVLGTSEALTVPHMCVRSVSVLSVLRCHAACCGKALACIVHVSYVALAWIIIS